MSRRFLTTAARCWSLFLGRTFQFRFSVICWLICVVSWAFAYWRTGEVTYLLLATLFASILAMTIADRFFGSK